LKKQVSWLSFSVVFFIVDLIVDGLKKYCFRDFMMFNIFIWYIDDLRGVIDVLGC
jgi:hypothetical protein